MLDTKFWERYFQVYDFLNASLVYQELLRTVIERADIKAGNKILDVGVGTGNMALLMIERGALVTGLDFSTEALRIFQNKCPTAQSIHADLSEPLPFKNNTFDIVISNNTLYTLPRSKRPRIIHELNRILKPGGKIVLSNLKRNYKPIVIYLESIRKLYLKNGLLDSFKKLIILLPAALRIFYYNFKIQAAYKISSDNLFGADEQKTLLEEAGFINVSETVLVYAGQGILNSGQKKQNPH